VENSHCQATLKYPRSKITDRAEAQHFAPPQPNCQAILLIL